MLWTLIFWVGFFKLIISLNFTQQPKKKTKTNFQQAGGSLNAKWLVVVSTADRKSYPTYVCCLFVLGLNFSHSCFRAGLLFVVGSVVAQHHWSTALARPTGAGWLHSAVPRHRHRRLCRSTGRRVGRVPHVLCAVWAVVYGHGGAGRRVFGGNQAVFCTFLTHQRQIDPAFAMTEQVVQRLGLPQTWKQRQAVDAGAAPLPSKPAQ